ncbi:MAG TPA: type II toxin-antitoxin system VapC family toxin [Rhizomicrobium sp.]|nr:type II toxin-antitoxin system VapC family toxin [Rhizomicrobium sp.]
MIVDSSALIAILRQEPEADILAEAIDDAQIVQISAGTMFEASMVADRIKDAGFGKRFDTLCERIEMVVVPFDEIHARIARNAYREFGKGSGHKAQLNFGDCFAYALAKVTGEPLLYKGKDFQHTDVASALK